ncbi:MAG TPA: prepilin peptidase [Thiolapillus brandeum]|uniref:Prepilin leader peptidase/N-methyltransferase n=1 Tax=Thiolapillus brandeum TaxID=1076588 RepID=A0A831NYC7_9GAMM|nr:prepilin peptidase [Thiolapillus brandeum]
MKEILSQAAIFYPLTFVLGLIVGSFLNVVIYRLPKRMEQELQDTCDELAGRESDYRPNKWFGLSYLITPSSTCLSCGHRIKAWENIPILSWLLQKGRCTSCDTCLSVQYPIVELLTALLSLVVAWQFGFSWQTLAALLLTWALIAMSVIDIKLQLLPDVLILPLIWLGLLLNLNGWFTDIDSAIYGAVAGYLSLWFIFHLFLLATGKEGMGYGDFKLFALFGAWLGWQLLPQILLLSALVGAISGLGMILFMGRDKALPIPFGPYLAAAGWIAMLWGDEINRAYLQFAGIG